MRSRVIAVVCALYSIMSGAGCRATTSSSLATPFATVPGPTGNPAVDYARALQLQRSGQHLASVPFFRSVSRASPRDGGLHLDYGVALHNESIQTDVTRGAVRFVVPCSDERARLRRESLVELRTAIALAATDEDRAYAWSVDSRLLEIMGRPLEAREALERALVIRPDEPALLDAYARLNRTLYVRADLAAQRAALAGAHTRAGDSRTSHWPVP